MASDDGRLDKCGCCKGIETRKARYNQPGLQSIEYRLDTHSGFFNRALLSLHLQKAQDESQPLRALTTRSRDDPAIAFIDAWALVADVLTFYQERVANEGFLRTLRERRSALELARSIGYELKPGVAASVYLAFSMEEQEGSPKAIIVPKGLAVKSIPPPGKLPQTFEITEDAEARVEWNALLPMLREEQRVGKGSTRVLLDGAGTSLQPGDALLFVAEDDSQRLDGQAWHNCTVNEVSLGSEDIVSLKWYPPLMERTRSFLLKGRHDLTRGDPILFQRAGGPNRMLKEVRGIGDFKLATWDDPLIGGLTQLQINDLSSGIKAGDKILFGPAPGQKARLIKSLNPLKRVVGEAESDLFIVTLEGDSLEKTSTNILINADLKGLGKGDAVVLVGEYRQSRIIKSMKTINGKTLFSWKEPLSDGTTNILLTSNPTDLKTGDLLIFLSSGSDVRRVDSAEYSPGRSLVTWSSPLPDGSRGTILEGDFPDVKYLLFEGDPWQVRTVVDASKCADKTLLTLDGAIEEGTTQLMARVSGSVLNPKETISFGRYAWQVRTISNIEFGSNSTGRYTRVFFDSPLFGEHSRMRLKWKGEAIALNDQISFEVQGWQMRILKSVTFDPEGGSTLATWEEPLGIGLGDTGDESFSNPQIYAMRARPDIDGSTLGIGKIDLEGTYPRILPGSWAAMTLDEGLYRIKTVSIMSLERKVEVPLPGGAPSLEFKSKAKVTRIEPESSDGLENFFDLETALFAQSEPLILAAKKRESLIRGNSIELDRAVYGLEAEKTLIISGKLMRVRIDADDLQLASSQGVKKTLNRGDSLRVLKVSDTSDEAEREWTLVDGDGFEGLLTAADGEISLQPALEDDLMVSEAVILSSTKRLEGRTILSLEGSMGYCYDPETFRVSANVARATHGGTLTEVLGSGDGSKSNQRFELGKPHLTYVSAPTASGIKSTLVVRINGIEWNELPSLYGIDERSQSYIVRIDDSDLASIIFGDGKSGARLPTGNENIIATYRSGIGLEGEVAEKTLTILPSRPLGISDVTNPLPASGSAPREELADARSNAPLTVLTLDRIISLRDFENFSRTFAGIGKAQAISIPLGQSKVVHITIASSSGSKIEQESDLFVNLVAAIDALRDPVARIQERVYVNNFQPRTFSLEAGVILDPRYIAEEVLDRIEAELRAAFSFAGRNFGQYVTAAEVLDVIQAIEGVVAVDLDRLERDDAPVTGRSPQIILEAKKARIDLASGEILPAELLLLNPAAKGVLLKELKS